MKKLLIVVGLLVSLGIEAEAQEFWMLPRKGKFPMGETIVIGFMMGDQFAYEFSANKIVPFNVQRITATATSDVTKDVKLTKGNNLQVKPVAEGIQVFSFQGNKVIRDWEGDKFEEYVEDNGLENVKSTRMSTGKVGQAVREEFVYCAKLVVQAGDKEDEGYKKVAGLRLEIIPAQNPCGLKVGDHLQCQVLFDGKPSPHRLVKVWSRINSTSFVQNIYTEDDGTIVFPISTKGPWMVSTVRSEPGKTRDFGWQTVLSSFTFGI